ncbi:hypothetical protein LZ575_22005 [Antarcticibacterium sp. 1MA-6-2]|uniref:hypothetical protein n=1 Tax=Antarcticibacterium sp. 1MA-6-2 TaxID=2908210 RepID=UPI001F463E97|nr:hypothetical protein [Antarcticibacterium sp. 1MA-6-2]UJH91227.1 hypothetical protein LZ575_22005 [Antarcticibacterium sp. 1MA-6-2]
MKRENIGGRINLVLIIFIIGFFQFNGNAQETLKNSVSLSTEEGLYSISFPNGNLITTSLKVEDSTNPSNSTTDSLLINLGTTSEISLSTIPVSDTLKITLKGLELNLVKNPFSIDYQFAEPWYNFETGKKYASGSSFKVTGKQDLIPKLIRAGSLVPLVKTERDELWQVHHFFESKHKQKIEKFCSEDFKAPAGEECIEVSYQFSGKEILYNVNASSSSPTTDEMELVLHGLEDQIEFVWLNNIKYTAKNFLHQGKQFIPLRFDYPKNVIRIELKK